MQTSEPTLTRNLNSKQASRREKTTKNQSNSWEDHKLSSIIIRPHMFWLANYTCSKKDNRDSPKDTYCRRYDVSYKLELHQRNANAFFAACKQLPPSLKNITQFIFVS